jgi:hypothetical protein
VRELGFSPYVLKPKNEFGTFMLSLKAYLRSGIPAVLVIEEEGEYHAVATAGFRAADDKESAAPIRIQPGGEHKRPELVSEGVSRLYIHDDRFGPYVRMRLKAAGDADAEPILERVPFPGQDPVKAVHATVCYAVFPLYPKLRLTVRELIDLAGTVTPFFRVLLGTEREKLRVDLRFALSGEYLRHLYGLGLPPDRIERFTRAAALSRYVGVIRFFLEDNALADIVCDTTDISRDAPALAPVLALVPFNEKHVEPFKDYARQNVPWALVA